jgi:hypothetical protein
VKYLETNPKMRPCLGDECQKTGKKFRSASEGNRFCPPCDEIRKKQSAGKKILGSKGSRTAAKAACL